MYENKKAQWLTKVDWVLLVLLVLLIVYIITKIGVF